MKYLSVLCVTLASILCFTNADSHWKCGRCSCDFFPVGDKENPGFSCRNILENNDKARDKDGIYWITLSDRDWEAAFPVYCDMTGGGWTMVFKAVTGYNQIAYEAYKSAQTYSEDKKAAIDVTNKHPNHYKNRIVLNWVKFGASEARVVLYEKRNPVKQLKFNAVGTNNENWFQFNKLTESPWTDLGSKPRNLFTIEAGDQRSFIINSQYGGCPNDVGWMVITGGGCSWERHFRQHSILYSKKDSVTNWNVYGNVGKADTMVIFLR